VDLVIRHIGNARLVHRTIVHPLKWDSGDTTVLGDLLFG
jgi:hypothetical protein